MKDKTRVIHVEPEHYKVIERMAESFGVSRSEIGNMLLRTAIARIPQALKQLEDGGVTMRTRGTEAETFVKEVLGSGVEHLSNEPIHLSRFAKDACVWVAHQAGKRNFEIVKELGVPESSVRRIIKRMQAAQA